MGVKDSTLLTVEKLNAWNRFSKSFGGNENIEAIITLQDLKKLIKNQKNQQFDFEPIINDSIRTNEELKELQRFIIFGFSIL